MCIQVYVYVYCYGLWTVWHIYSLAFGLLTALLIQMTCTTLDA